MQQSPAAWWPSSTDNIAYLNQAQTGATVQRWASCAASTRLRTGQEELSLTLTIDSGHARSVKSLEAKGYAAHQR